MKYHCLTLLFVVLLSTLIAGAQDRLHTADALVYALSQERQLVLKTVLGENNSLCDGAFIDESNCQGFRIDMKNSAITLTTYSLGYEDNSWRLKNLNRYSVVVDRSVSSGLSWLYNLAVSTSSPQNPPAVMDGSPCSFVFANMIADWNCNGSYSLIGLSRKVCAAVENNNPVEINALKESIGSMINDYKKYVSLDVEEDKSVNYIGIGSSLGPCSVTANSSPSIDVVIYKNTLEEFAGFLLEKSMHPFHYQITVTKDSEWIKVSESGSFVDIGIRKKDFSIEKLKSISQGWLWAPDI